MAIALHSRVRVTKHDATRGFVGSVVALRASDADVVLDDGRDRQDGGKLPPAPAVTYLLTELAEA